MAQGTCSIADCAERGRARGWCDKHYRRWRRYGDPLITHCVRNPGQCSVEDCEKRADSRGWCQRHYDAWRNNGDPLKVTRIFGDDEARFWSKVNKDGPVPAYAPRLGHCWIWTGTLNAADYGTFQMRDHGELAHRRAYELVVEAIPEGLHLDHLCRVHPCVNPAHLEPVTRAVNNQRGAEARLAERGNRCVNGHEMTPGNTYVSRDGKRQACRTCVREAQRRHRERRVQRDKPVLTGPRS